jgi:hypothetical protein
METKKRDSLNMSTKEGSVLNADDLKLAEMGYKPVQLSPLPGQKIDGVGTFEGVQYDVGYGVGV